MGKMQTPAKRLGTMFRVMTHNLGALMVAREALTSSDREAIAAVLRKRIEKDGRIVRDWHSRDMAAGDNPIGWLNSFLTCHRIEGSGSRSFQLDLLAALMVPAEPARRINALIGECLWQLSGRKVEGVRAAKADRREWKVEAPVFSAYPQKAELRVNGNWAVAVRLSVKTAIVSVAA